MARGEFLPHSLPVPMRITLYAHRASPVPEHEFDHSWADVIEMFQEPEVRAEKDGMLWSPVELAPGRKRGNANVIWVGCAVFDLDSSTIDELAALTQRLEGREYILHTTFSHTADKPKLRLVMSLSRPVRALDWPRAHAAIVERYQIPTDPACKDVSRAYYLPSHPPGGTYEVESVPGEPIDVGSLRLGERERPLAIAPRVTDSFPTAQDDDPVSYEAGDIRKRIQTSIRGQQEEGLRKLIEGQPLATKGSRDTTLNKVMSQLAWRVAPNTPWEALLPIVAPSIAAIDHEDGEDWLQTAAQQYLRAQARAQEFRENERLRRDSIMNALKSRVAQPSLIEVEDVSWDPDTKLMMRWTKEGPVPEACLQNATTILQDHPELAGRVRFNTLKKSIDVTGGPLKDADPSTLAAWAAMYLHTQHGVKLATQVVKEALLSVAKANKYNPVSEWLAGLEWDGQERLDTMLETYFGASTVDEDGRDITDHVRRVSSKFLIAAVARGVEPGCQVDTTLIIEGPQGGGKTEAFRALGGDWYLSAETAAGDKDAKLAATAGWIVELAELSSFRKADAQAIKAFLDKRIDHFRPPYGDVIEAHPRGCVFVGTTNDTGYLTDRTGNRRYWPISCPGTVALEAIKRDREQLFAEALARYHAGERWHLIGEEQRIAGEIADARVGEDEVEGVIAAIESWWDRLPHDRRKKVVEQMTTSWVTETVVGIPVRDQTRAHVTRTGTALRKIGWVTRRSRASEGRQRTYHPPDTWYERPVVSLTKKP